MLGDGVLGGEEEEHMNQYYFCLIMSVVSVIMNTDLHKKNWILSLTMVLNIE